MLGANTLILTNAADTFSGGIAGTGGITIAGGTETLTGSNGYTGATAIASGATLALAGTGSIASSRTVDAEGTFDVSQENGSVSIASLSGAGAVALGVNTLVLSNAANTFSGAIEGAGGITVAGGTQTLTGGNSYTGTTTIASGATLALAGAGSIASSSTADVEGRLDISQANGGASVTSLSGAGAVMLGANTLVFTNAADTFSGVISGAGNLTVSGGAETLSGANTYTGTTTVAGGMLIMGANAVLAPGSSLIVGNAGTLDLGSYNQTVTNAALSGVVNGTGSATLTAQTYSLTGATINANLGTGTLNVGAGASMLNGTAQTSVLNIDAGSLALGAQNLLPANIAVALSNAGTLNIGAYDQTIGSLAGQGSVQINSATLNVAQATDSSFAGSIAGNGTFSKSGAGTLVLTGDNSFAGTTNIVGGTLEVDGSLASSAVSVGSNAALAGTGSVGSLIVGQGAMLVPGVGGSIGTLAVAGNLLFQSGSTFQVNVTPTAASAVNVNGAITIQGGVVSVMANGTAYKVGTATYPVLTATGGVSGTFSTVKSNLVFLVPTLSYTANAVDLTLTRNNVDFASVAQTPNQRAVANTLNLMATDATLVQDVQSLSAPQARQAYDALSGQTYAALPSALIEESSRVRDTLLADGRRSGDGFGVFGDAMDDGGEFNATSDTAKLATHRQGIIAGIDYGHGGFRAGVASGYSYGTYLMGGLGSQSQVKSYYAGGQLSYQAGPIRAQIGGAYSWHDINTSRSADFADFTETLQSKQKAHTLQGFGELGYALIQRAGFKLEPFVGYAHIHAFVGGTNEMGSNGSLAALDVVAVKRDVNDATAGFHLTGSTPIGTGKALFQPHLTLAWQHAWGDRAGTATVALPGTAPFDIIGATLVGDSVKIDGGFDVAFGRITLGASYVGAAGTNQADHGVKANATMRF
jgi:autotransporter-associated beta strand protein